MRTVFVALHIQDGDDILAAPFRFNHSVEFRPDKEGIVDPPIPAVIGVSRPFRDGDITAFDRASPSTVFEDVCIRFPTGRTKLGVDDHACLRFGCVHAAGSLFGLLLPLLAGGGRDRGGHRMDLIPE